MAAVKLRPVQTLTTSSLSNHRRRIQPLQTGSLVEVSVSGKSAGLSYVAHQIRLMQGSHDMVVWLTTNEAGLIAGDDARVSGIDLAQCTFVKTPSVTDAGRAADKLIRSGAFGLIVLDATVGEPPPEPLLSRLQKLTRKHQCSLIMVTRKDDAAPSLSSMVSVRLSATRRCLKHAPWSLQPSYEVVPTVLRNKTPYPIEETPITCYAPEGLR